MKNKTTSCNYCNKKIPSNNDWIDYCMRMESISQNNLNFLQKLFESENFKKKFCFCEKEEPFNEFIDFKEGDEDPI